MFTSYKDQGALEANFRLAVGDESVYPHWSLGDSVPGDGLALYFAFIAG